MVYSTTWAAGIFHWKAQNTKLTYEVTSMPDSNTATSDTLSRWNFELSLGGGFARIHYDKYPCVTCGAKVDEGDQNYLGVTKAAISLIYMIR